MLASFFIVSLFTCEEFRDVGLVNENDMYPIRKLYKMQVGSVNIWVCQGIAGARTKDVIVHSSVLH